MAEAGILGQPQALQPTGKIWIIAPFRSPHLMQCPDVDKSDFDFQLPAELIAQQPLAQRSASRMLIVDGRQGGWHDSMLAAIETQLCAGDLLIFNDTRVLPARLAARKESGGAVEVLVERLLGTHTARVQLRANRAPREGAVLLMADGSRLQVRGRDGEFFLLESEQPLLELLERLGRMPLPPYITRNADHDDVQRYQTVFARHVGAVAAPTAGLHFDEPLLARLREHGVDSGYVTLHVGAGTFQPMRVQQLSDHIMHSEWCEVSAALVERVHATRAAGGRVIAVGTTVVRALESALHGGQLQPWRGETRIFIYPGYRISTIDGLLTNFHLPQSTLLMLVSALAGRQLVLDAYRHAVAQRYRFFSYGDAMLVWPPHDAGNLPSVAS